MKKIIFAGILIATTISSYTFANRFTASAKKVANNMVKPKASYQELERKVKMLEKQISIMQNGWSSCLQEYEILMGDCQQACDGNI